MAEYLIKAWYIVSKHFYYWNSLQLAKEALHRDKQVQMKGASSDLVTETDKKVEELIFSSLKEKFPTHKLVPWCTNRLWLYVVHECVKCAKEHHRTLHSM